MEYLVSIGCIMLNEGGGGGGGGYSVHMSAKLLLRYHPNS